MDVSTRAQPSPPSGASGARETLRLAAWFAPLLVPLGLLQALLITTPWLDSLEAAGQGALLSRASEWAARERLEWAVAVAGGLPGATVIAFLLVAAWLMVLRLVGPLRPDARRGAASDGTPRHRRHALVLASILAGSLGCLAVQEAASTLNRLVDAVTSLRPTGPASLVLLATSQAFEFAAWSALIGATLGLARRCTTPRSRVGALLALAGVGAAAAGAEMAAGAAIGARFDVGRSFAVAVGPAEVPSTVMMLALARDRSWVVPVRDGVGSVGFSADAAARAEDLLSRRRGWTTLAPQAERYVIGERLLALDPDGARRAALRSVLRGCQPQTASALLIALGTAAPSDEARSLVDLVETAPDYHFGAQARLFIAQAHAQGGDRERAERALGRFRGGDEAQVIAARQGLPLVLNRLLDGRVRGRLRVAGEPHRGRVALVFTSSLFSLPRNELHVAEAWLLRLIAAEDVRADGSFEIGGLPEGEMALVLMIRGAGPLALPAGSALPRIELSASVPECDLGDIELVAAGG